jgi:flagellar assembly protein FliH
MAAAAPTQSEAPRGPVRVDARAWTAPVIDGAAMLAGRTRRGSEELREEDRRAFAEAERRGYAAGVATAQKEADARCAVLDEHARALGAMLEALSRPIAHLDDSIHEQIAMLAVHIARAVVRRELRTDPTQIIGIVRETVALLPVSTRGPRVLLNPEDAALVRQRLSPSGPESAWSIVEDAMLARGDCRVHTDNAQLDARLETRLDEALTALIGDERARPRGGEAD